jgi:cytochrome b561
MSRALASRYQPVLVALHWLVALMIIGLLCLGFFVLADMPNTDPRKLDILVWHMSGGMFVLVLMILRVIIRIWSARPAIATIGSPLFDQLASIAHKSFYVIVFLMSLPDGRPDGSLAACSSPMANLCPTHSPCSPRSGPMRCLQRC